MSITKEYVNKGDGVHRFIIRRGDYGHTLDAIMQLYNEAKKDFYTIDHSLIDIVHYGGQRYKYTYGIEFDLEEPVPDGYREISQVEFSL